MAQTDIRNTPKKLDKSFVNIVRESLIKPTPGTRFLFIKYQQSFSVDRGYLIKNPSSKHNKRKISLFFVQNRQIASRSLTRRKQNTEKDMHRGTNFVTAFLFVVNTKKLSTSTDRKNQGAQLINKEIFFL